MQSSKPGAGSAMSRRHFTQGLIGCATGAAVGVQAQGSYQVLNDVEFTAEPMPLKLDAHIPAGEGPFPAIILVHGGGWRNGDKRASFIQPLFPVLDRTGYAWFSIDYRLAPTWPYTAMIEDCERALQFVKKNARRFKVRPDRIALMGESAGAHLVNLIGVRNKKPNNVDSVVSFYGPMNLMDTLKLTPGGPINDGLKAVFGIDALDAAGVAKIQAGSPDTHVHRGSAPFLFIHGTDDAAVPYAQSPLGMELLKKAGVKCDLITVQGGIHGVINWEKDTRFHGYKQQMIDWLKMRLER